MYAYSNTSATVQLNAYVSYSENITYTYYASVTFDGNGATSGSKAAILNQSSTDKNGSFALGYIGSDGFKRTGYTFAGWNTKADGTGVSYNDNGAFPIYDSTTKGGRGPVTLYAQWKPYSYTVKFNNNSGSGTTMSELPCTYDQEFALPANTYTKDGKAFAGWSTDKYASDGDYADGQTVKNLTETNGGSVTLYAVWKTGYTVAVTPSTNGSVTPSVSSLAYEGQEVTLTISPETGYTIDQLTVKRTDTDAEVFVSADNKFTMPDMPVNISATFKLANYDVIFDNNGGTGTMTPMICTYNDSFALSANTFTNTGYNFAGWATSADGAVVYADGATVSNLTTEASITLYAVWNVISGITISTDSNGSATAR